MARFSLRRLLGNERGGAVVEFGLVVPLLFLIIWAIMSFGRGYHRLNVLTGALRHGGRIASTLVVPCGLDKPLVDSAVAQHSRAFGSEVDVSSAAYSVSCSNPGEVRVRVINYPLFTGIDFFGLESIVVTREAIFRRERP